MVLSLEQNTFIVMPYCRKGTVQNGEWVYTACKEEFFRNSPNDNIMEANLISHIRRTVDRFVATGGLEKGKVWKDSLQADVPFSTCQNIVRKNLNTSIPNKTLQELQPADYEKRLEYCNWFKKKSLFTLVTGRIRHWDRSQHVLRCLLNIPRTFKCCANV
jgi:hypothetical protein